MRKFLSSFIKKYSTFFISLFSSVLLLSICVYLIAFVIFVFHNNDFSIVDNVFSLILMVSISFWSMHCIGYLDHLLKSKLIYKLQIKDISPIDGNIQPKVAIFIPVFNENPEIVKSIIRTTKQICYNNFEIFLLDDSNEGKIVKKLEEVVIKYNIHYIHRENRRGYKAGAINDAIKSLEKDIKYILILDVDHRPKHNILSEVIPRLEENIALAFIQTPQYFICENENRLSLAYSFQQHIFHKHVCRGLDINNTVFMCGTNLIVRLEYLINIGGMDERCITEDIATSFVFHSTGYKSLYLDQIYAEGIPPPSLSAYYTQQMRWSYGTVQNLRNVLKTFLKNPHSLKPIQWWEYIVLNGLWYFSGWTVLFWLIYPIIVLLFGVQPHVFWGVSLPFLVIIMTIGCQFFTSIFERGYRLKDLLISQGLFLSLFPVYIHATILALMDKKLDFKVTPKERTNAISFSQLYPQFIILILLIVSIIVGIWRVAMGQITISHIYAIISWALFSATALFFMFYHFYLEDIKREDKINNKSIKSILQILLVIFGAFLAAVLPQILVPNIEPIYVSNIIIDQNGANYTTALWEYHIQPKKIFNLPDWIQRQPKDNWAFFNMNLRNIENNLNLSDFKGVSFYIIGEIDNQFIQFNLFTQNITDNRNDVYQYRNNGSLLVTTNWRKEEILFSNLNVTDWTKESYPFVSKSPDLEKVYAFGFAIHTKDEPKMNRISIDEIYLIHKNGSKILLSNFNTLDVNINGVEGIWHTGSGKRY